jgi:hypothetical protein
MSIGTMDELSDAEYRRAVFENRVQSLYPNATPRMLDRALNFNDYHDGHTQTLWRLWKEALDIERDAVKTVKAKEPSYVMHLRDTIRDILNDGNMQVGDKARRELHKALQASLAHGGMVMHPDGDTLSDVEEDAIQPAVEAEVETPADLLKRVGDECATQLYARAVVEVKNRHAELNRVHARHGFPDVAELTPEEHHTLAMQMTERFYRDEYEHILSGFAAFIAKGR